MNVLEYAGGIVGENEAGALVENSHATGNITATYYDVGGLVGISYGTVKNSWASGNVSSPQEFIGGLIGGNGGTVTDSYATGSVSGGVLGVGGLIGGSIGPVTGSYATGPVTATNTYWVGGLIGHNHLGGAVTSSYATGSVTTTGGYDIGGLVGGNDTGATVNSSYALGKVSATGYDVVGLVGYNSTVYNEPNPPVVTAAPSLITSSYAKGRVSGSQAVGGLIGYNDTDCSVKDAYSYGIVDGTSYVGGLAGVNNGDISITYTIGEVKGTTDVGGLVGGNVGTVSDSYWLHTGGNRRLFGVGTPSSDVGATPETETKLMEERTYDSAWGFPHSSIWDLNRRKNNSLPYLNWQTKF